MENCGFEVVDISENELAKSHGRYLVGGKSQSTKSSNEKSINLNSLKTKCFV